MKIRILLIFLLLFLTRVAYGQYTIGYPFSVPMENGSIPVVMADQYSKSLNYYICRDDGETTTTTAVALDATTVSVDSATGAAVGNCIDLIDETRMFQGLVTAINGTDITFTPGSDHVFAIGSTAHFGEWDLAQSNGSVTPQVFSIHPPSGVSWDITEIRINMTDNAAMDDSTFGGLLALTKGFVARKMNGDVENLFLVTNNAGFAEQGFFTEYPPKVPAGVYAFRAKKNYNDVAGVSLRVDGATDDMLLAINSSDLTGLLKMAITIQGHEVVNSDLPVATLHTAVAGQWTKIVDGKSLGNVKFTTDYLDNTELFAVFVTHGGAAPTLAPYATGSTAVKIENGYVPFSTPGLVDVYFWVYRFNINAVVTAF